MSLFLCSKAGGMKHEAICFLLLNVSTCGICSSVPVKCSLGSFIVTFKGYNRCIKRLVTPEFVLNLFV